MSELKELIETEIPNGRHNLESSFANLERVAAYCEANYLQATDKHAALEETKKYTVQSLASVAYQINTLASNLLQMLDLQVDKLATMESQVNNISQIVDIHKEKVARREIGVLTTNKVATRQHKIVAPASQDRPRRYARRPIDYEVLDEMGHGIKTPHARDPKHLITRTGSTISGSSGSSGSAAQMPPPPHMAGSGGVPAGYYAADAARYSSISKGTGLAGKEYRTPVSMAMGGAGQSYPQHLRQNSAAAYGMQHSNGSGVMSSNYSALQIGGHNTNSLPHARQSGAVGHGGQISQQQQFDDLSDLPPPPIDFMAPVVRPESPPLPPPPPTDDHQQYGTTAGRIQVNSARTSSQYSAEGAPDWVPPQYLERVIALFDYQADKPDELSFTENSIIYVLRKNEDGWFEGVLEGVTGLFPGNYVEPYM